MSFGEGLGFVALAVCFALGLTVVVTGGAIWLGFTFYRDRRRSERRRWTHLADILAFRVESPLPLGRLEGEVEGLAVAIEERPVSFHRARDLALGVAAVALGGDAGSSAVPVTFVRVDLRPSLAQSISFVHEGSGSALKSEKADKIVPGHTNPLADAEHHVRSADAGWAVSWLGQLRERGGVVDLETDGWRVSFTEAEALLERTSSASEPVARAGIERARRLVARLRPEAGYR